MILLNPRMYVSTPPPYSECPNRIRTCKGILVSVEDGIRLFLSNTTHSFSRENGVQLQNESSSTKLRVSRANSFMLTLELMRSLFGLTIPINNSGYKSRTMIILSRSWLNLMIRLSIHALVFRRLYLYGLCLRCRFKDDLNIPYWPGYNLTIPIKTKMKAIPLLISPRFTALLLFLGHC